MNIIDGAVDRPRLLDSGLSVTRAEILARQLIFLFKMKICQINDIGGFEM